MKGNEVTIAVLDEIDEIIKRNETRHGSRRSAQMVFEAHPVTKRIIDKWSQEGQVPKLADLFPGLKRRK